MLEDRYYVQQLTQQIFLVRQRKSVEEEQGPDDRIVRSFTIRHDAYLFASSLNEKQRQNDEQHGLWVQAAI
ncbi:MAG: hypothetical protein ACXWPS_06990 [Ktedonobacteraceae bacterium]